MENAIIKNTQIIQDDFNNSFKILANDIRECIKHVKMHEYEPFFEIFYVPERADKDFLFLLNEIEILEKEIENGIYNNMTIPRFNALKVQKDYIYSFHRIFFNNNIEHMKFIQNHILKPIKDYVYNINIFEMLKNLNQDISSLMYTNLFNFESFIKIAIVSVLTNDGKSFDSASDYKINSLTSSDKFKKMNTNPEFDPKKNWLIFNEMMLSEVMNFLKNINNVNLLEKILKNILGVHKYEQMRNGTSKKDVKEIRVYLLEKLNIVKELRNEIMHFDLVLPDPNNNKLMKCIKAMVEISKSNDGAVDQYLQLHSQILSMVSRFTTIIIDKQVLIYFQKNILSYEIY